MCKSVPGSVLRGMDVPELFTLLSRVRSQDDYGMAVITLSKLKQQQQLEARDKHVRDLQSGARPTSMDEPTVKEKGLDTCSVPEVQITFQGQRPPGFIHEWKGSQGVDKESEARDKKRRNAMSMDPVGRRSIRNGGSAQKKYEDCREKTRDSGCGSKFSHKKSRVLPTERFFQQKGTCYPNRKVRWSN